MANSEKNFRPEIKPKSTAPLVVLGSVNADIYVEIARLPQPGETIPGGGAAVRPGGKGANQAAAAARLGRPTLIIGQVGSDPFAADLRAALSASGVDIRAMTTVPGPSGQALILLQSGGENSIVIVGGANRAWAALSAGDCTVVQSAGALLLQREVPDAINVAAATIAHAAGIPVIMDAGGDDTPLPPGLLPLLSVFSPNESELARLTGLPTGDQAQVMSAAGALQAQGCGTVVVKLGARGCLLVPVTGAVIAQPAFTVPVVDTTGAGDCFTAAYTTGLIAGLPEHERLRRACAAAALSVQRKGALQSMPNANELSAFLSSCAKI